MSFSDLECLKVEGIVESRRGGVGFGSWGLG
jgi:hypothetical protein